MVSYRIEWKKSAIKELRKIKKEIIPKVIEVVTGLADNPYPSGSRKLKGSMSTYRIRVGDYRVVYVVRSDIVVIEIIRVGHRKEIYRKFT